MREGALIPRCYIVHMSETRIIVANGLASYRDTLAYTLRALRPAVEITAVEPDFLDAEVARVEPDLVICDCITEVVEARVRSWVEMYTDHGPISVACVGGYRSELEVEDLDALLGVLDRVEGLNPPGGAEAPGVQARNTAAGGATA